MTLHPGSRIDRFQILESLGVGGFSEVYSVNDCESPNRPPLAMKVMRMGLNSDEFLSRFEQEHHVLRRLEDPGIVRVFDSGINDDGRPYFVMEQIDGLRITDYCQCEKLSLESRIELFIAVCRAVHHAHQKGIIHRDLKPANILVTHRDGVSVPCVIDFGLAKAVESWNDASHSESTAPWVTRLGVTMGTPGYISPEQADGDDDTDTLSDVFSLGSVLYEVIAQRPPWPHETWKRIPHSKWSNHKRENVPPKPSSHGELYTTGRRIDDDLDTICSKALATDRRQRYDSVAQLATDLTHWLRGDPISARPPSLTYRLSKLASRYRWQSATLMATLVTCILSAVFGVTLAIRERRYSSKLAFERSAAVDAETRATALSELAVHERTVAQQQAYASSINLATLHIASSEPYLSQQILNSTEPSLRGWEWTYLQSLIPNPVLSLSSGLSSAISFGISENRQFAVVCDGNSLSRLDLNHPTQPNPCKLQAKIQHVAITNDGQYIAALSHQPQTFVRVYQHTKSSSPGETDRLKEIWSCQVLSDSSLAWETVGQTSALIVAEGNGPEPAEGSLRKFHASTGQVLSKYALKRWKLADKGMVLGKSLGIFRCSFDRLAVLRLSDFMLLGYIHGETNSMIDDYEFNSDESRVVFSHIDSIYEAQWDQAEEDVAKVKTNAVLKKLLTVDRKLGGAHRLNRTQDNRWMAITDTHCVAEEMAPVPLPTKTEIQIVSLLDGTYATVLPHGAFEIRREIQELDTNRFAGRSILPIPEGRRAVVAPSSEYCLYQTWSRQNIYRCSLIENSEPELLPTPENPKLEWCRLPYFHPDGTALFAQVSANADASSQLAALPPGAQPGDFITTRPLPINDPPWSAAASPDGVRLFVGTARGVSVIDWPRGETVKEWPLDHGPFVVMPMANNSGVFAIGCDHVLHSLQLNRETDESVRIIDEGKGAIPAHSDYFADEQVLAINDSNGVSVFQLGKSHRKLQRIPVEASVNSVRFSVDGKRLAIAMGNRKIAVWDWQGKHRLLELPTRGTCSCMDFSRDGRWLINTDYAPCLTIR